MKKQITKKNKENKRKKGTRKTKISKTKTNTKTKTKTKINRRRKSFYKTHKRNAFYGGTLDYKLLYKDGTELPKIDEMFYEDDTTYEQLRGELAKISKLGVDKITLERSDNGGKSYKKITTEYSNDIPDNVTHIRVNISAPVVDAIAQGISQGAVSFDSAQKVDAGYLDTLSNTSLIKKTIKIGNTTYDGMMTGNNREGNKGYGTVRVDERPNVVFEGRWDETGSFASEENKLIVTNENGSTSTYTGKINQDFSGTGTITNPDVFYTFEGSWDSTLSPSGDHGKIKVKNPDNGQDIIYEGIINLDTSGRGTISFSNNPHIKFEGAWDSHLNPIGDNNKLYQTDPADGGVTVFEGQINNDFSGIGVIKNDSEPFIFNGRWDSNFSSVGNNNTLTYINPETGSKIVCKGIINNDYSGEGVITYSDRPNIIYEGMWDSVGAYVGDKNKLTYKDDSTGETFIFKGKITLNDGGHGNVIIDRGKGIEVKKGVLWDANFKILNA